MFEKTYRLLKFLDETGQIVGRKKFQKMIYLLQNMDLDFDVRYTYHHYGPYSPDLQIFLDSLVDKGLVEENYSQVTGAYEYSLTGESEKLISDLEGNYEEYAEFALPKDKLEKLKNKTPQFLEVLSTYAFLIENGYPEEKAIEKTNKLKPELNEYMEEALEYFESLIVS